MTNDELNETLSNVVDYWPETEKWLVGAKAMNKLWRETLRRYDFFDVQSAIRRWAATHKVGPVLDSLQTLIEEQQANRSRTRAATEAVNAGDVVFDTLSDVADKQRTPDDLLWAQIHVQLYRRIEDKPQQERERIMTEHYQRWRDEYPQFAGDCGKALDEMGASDEVAF